MIALSTHGGLALPFIASHRGLQRQDLATIDSVGPLPSIGEPVSIPIPTQYYAMSSHTGDGPFLVPNEAGPESMVLYYEPGVEGLFGVGVAGDGRVPDLIGTLTVPDDDFALSFWVYGDTSVTVGGNGKSRTIPAIGDGWHHICVSYAAGVTESYVDGIASGSGDFGVIISPLTISIDGTSDAYRLDEVAYFGPGVIVDHAVVRSAIYNSGLGAVFREGQWWEILAE